MVRRKKNKRKSKIILEKDRTILADERTLLAYIRTSLSFFIFAIFVYKFFPEYPNILWIFIGIITLGVIILIIGFFEYIFFERETNRI